MRTTHSLITFLVLILVQVYGQATIPCTYTDGPTGLNYDLNSLVDDSDDYIIDVPTGTDSQTLQGYRITLNVCRPILLQACALQGGSNVDACQQWPLPQFQHSTPLGLTTGTYFISAEDTSGQNGEGVTMRFTGFQSSVSLNFICDSKAGKGNPTYVTKPNSSSFELQWKSIYGFPVNVLNNQTAVINAVKNYATYLNTEQCDQWAKLFAKDGIKYDEPAPIVGYNALVEFCESTFTDFTSFTYTLVGPILVTNSDGYKALVQWMLGGTEAGGVAYVQTGYGSFVFDNQMLIQTETGYNLQDSSYPASASTHKSIIIL